MRLKRLCQKNLLLWETISRETFYATKQLCRMNHWMPFPFLRFVMWLIAGMIAGFYVPASLYFCILLLIILGSTYCLLYFFRHFIPAFRIWLGINACLLLFFLGFGRMLQQKAFRQIPDIPSGTQSWLLEVEQDGIPTARTIRFQARILSFQQAGSWKKGRGGLMLYVQKDSFQRHPVYGDRFLLRAALQEIPGDLNPNTFNYKAFLANQGTGYQAFIKSSQLAFLGNKPSYPLLSKAKEVQRWGSRQLSTYLPGSRESAIASALLLGDRSALEGEVKQAYATAGVMHILAVSGLHVGFIYLLMQLLFRPWRRTSLGKAAGFLLTLLLLWAYAFITGLSPSVLRAVCMFSLLSFALLLKRKSGIYNTLAVAAFALLLYDPYFLFSVGFQLSFLALLGIVYLQPRMAAYYSEKGKVYRRFLDLLTVSVAAQLATFPLGLFYFGQFPTYFFISNLLVVPAASLVVMLGLLLLLSSLLSSSLASGVGWLLDKLLGLVNEVVFFADSLPYSRLSTTLGIQELLLLMAFLLLVLGFLKYKKLTWAALAFVAGLGFVGSLFHALYLQKQQRKMIAYHVSGFAALHLIEGREEYLYAPQPLPASQLQYQLQPNRLAMGLMGLGHNAVRDAFKPPMQQQGPFKIMVWRGQTFVFVTEKPGLSCTQKEPVKVDFVILSANLIQDLESLSCYFTAGKIIIDGSNAYWLQNKLQQQAEALNLPYHITGESGAFALDLQE